MKIESEFLKPIKMFSGIMAIFLAFGAVAFITKGCSDYKEAYVENYEDLGVMSFKPSSTRVSVQTKTIHKNSGHSYKDLNPSVETKTETKYILEYTDTQSGRFTWERFYNSEWETEKFLKSGIEVVRRVIILKKGSRPYVTVDPDETVESYMNTNKKKDLLVMVLGSLYLILFASFIIFIVLKKFDISKRNRQEFFNKTVVSGSDVWKDQDNNRE